jgi:hypothetical protein
VGEYPGTTHAHTDLYFNEFWHNSGKAQPAPQKQKKKRKCRKPCILKIHEGSREIMPFGRFAIIVQEKRFGPAQAIFFVIFD